MSERTRERALETWSPFRELGFGLGRVFDDLLAERTRTGRFAPALDVCEGDGSWTLSLELPGAKREDISIEVHDDLLTIRGEKKCEREEKGEKRHYVERSYGSFTRSLQLPPQVDPERIKASFQEGVLTVEIPKTEAQKPKVIDIKAS